MAQDALEVRTRDSRAVLRAGLVGLAMTSTVTVTIAAILVPSLVRGLLAALIAAVITVTWLRWPSAGFLLAMAYLPLLAVIRRLLIPIDGFTSYDPLLLVAPFATMVVLARLYLVERRPLAPTLLTKLVLALFLITVLEAFNPEGGSVSTGVTALLFLAAPLAWFFIGRELVDRHSIGLLLGMVVCVAVAISLYGLYQTGIGFPEWDRRWVAINGYAALDVGGSIRPFGTFSSGQEYATYLGMALVISLTLVLRRRFWAAFAVPVLGAALVIASARQPLVLALTALIGVVGLSTGRPRAALMCAFLAVSGAFFLERFAGQAITQSAKASNNPFVSHQVAGLADPLNPERSTLIGHVQLVLDGLAVSLHHPFGLGTAVTTIAAGTLKNQVASTEVDFSNAFLSLGWIGGLIFGSVVAMSLWRTLRLSWRQRDVVALACFGLLIATLGNWLNGGYYAVAPLVWLLIGWSSGDATALPSTRKESNGDSYRGNFSQWRGSL